MVTLITKAGIDHIHDRHGPGGKADALFDANFLKDQDSYGKIAKQVFERGVGEAETDSSGRLIYRFYWNFNTKTGTGVDKNGHKVVFKGVEMVGTMGVHVFQVETMFPKGILKA